jgi:hypothetical protein
MSAFFYDLAAFRPDGGFCERRGERGKKKGEQDDQSRYFTENPGLIFCPEIYHKRPVRNYGFSLNAVQLINSYLLPLDGGG